MHRMLAIVERDIRRFLSSPALLVMSLMFPLVQLIVLGYAFGGQVRNLKLGIVDQDQKLPAVKLRELTVAVTANARTFDNCLRSNPDQASLNLRE